jgi:uncharacterized membrane protein YfcA
MLPIMPELPLLALAAVTVLLSGFVQGMAGFGYVIIAAPVLTIFIAPALAVPVLVCLGFLVNLALMAHAYRALQLRRIWLLALMAGVGVPVGTALLVVLDEQALRIAIGVLVTLTALALLAGLRRPVSGERAASVPVGLGSGVLLGATGMGGLLVVLFYANQGLPPRTFRANTIFFLEFMNLVALPSFLLGGVLTADVGRLVGVLVAPSIVGMAVGAWAAHRVPAALFHRTALVVVLFAGIAAVGAGAGLW